MDARSFDLDTFSVLHCYIYHGTGLLADFCNFTAKILLIEIKAGSPSFLRFPSGPLLSLGFTKAKKKHFPEVSNNQHVS